MDETDPIALAQHQLRDDLELVQRYGREEEPEQFGGCYWDNIRTARQTWRQVEADNRQVADTLMPRTGLGVHGVGIGLHEQRFIICVHIEPYTAELAAQIAALVAPREVLVQQGGPYRIP